MRFRGLYEIVQHVTDEFITRQELADQPTSSLLGRESSESYSSASDNIFRWGESTWGTSSITGDDFPHSTGGL